MPLVVTRRVGQTIEIGTDIKVTVLGVKGIHVRVAVAAPKEMPVHREEVADRIRAGNGGQLQVGRRGAGRSTKA